MILKVDRDKWVTESYIYLWGKEWLGIFYLIPFTFLCMTKRKRIKEIYEICCLIIFRRLSIFLIPYF